MVLVYLAIVVYLVTVGILAHQGIQDQAFLVILAYLATAAPPQRLVDQILRFSTITAAF